MQWKQKNFGHENVEQMLVCCSCNMQLLLHWGKLCSHCWKLNVQCIPYHITVNYCQLICYLWVYLYTDFYIRLGCCCKNWTAFKLRSFILLLIPKNTYYDTVVYILALLFSLTRWSHCCHQNTSLCKVLH